MLLSSTSQCYAIKLNLDGGVGIRINRKTVQKGWSIAGAADAAMLHHAQYAMIDCAATKLVDDNATMPIEYFNEEVDFCLF